MQNPEPLDPLFEEAALLVFVHRQGSSSLLQRKLKIGYNRAGNIMDQLEVAGVVGPFRGETPRAIRFDDLGKFERFLSVYLNSKSKPAKLESSTKSGHDKIVIECFKNIIDIIIPKREYIDAYKLALDKMIMIDDVRSDFFKLLTRLYLWPLHGIKYDSPFPFYKFRLDAIGMDNLSKILDKRIIPNAETTIKSSGYPTVKSGYILYELEYKKDAILGMTEIEKLPSLDFYCNAAGITLKKIPENE